MSTTTTTAETEVIAKITSTHLGYEDHGILTAYLQMDYGGSGQGVGGYGLDEWSEEHKRRMPHTECGRWIAGVLSACGVDSWEKVKGRTVYVIRESNGWNAKVIGIKPLPTEQGAPFYFNEES